LEEPTASIIKVEAKMVAVGSSETFVNATNIAWHINLDQHITFNCCENLKSHNIGYLKQKMF
jgi:hypothetical protein